MRTLGIIIITAHAVIDAAIIGTFGWIIWTDHRDRRDAQRVKDAAAANEADSFDQWAREMGRV